MVKPDGVVKSYRMIQPFLYLLIANKAWFSYVLKTGFQNILNNPASLNRSEGGGGGGGHFRLHPIPRRPAASVAAPRRSRAGGARPRGGLR